MQLFVKTTTGKIVTLKVEGSDTLDFVIEKINEECGIDNYCNNIHLEFMPDPKSNPSLERKLTATLSPAVQRRRPPGSMQIFARINNEKTITMRPMFPDNTISHFMRMIKQEEDILQYDQNLFLAGTPLKRYGALARNNVHDGSTIDIMVVTSYWTKIFVETTDGKTIPLELQVDLGIIEVKTMIQAHVGIPIDQQRLVYAGDELHNEYYLSFYHIQNESTLRLYVDDTFKNRRVWMGIHVHIDATRKTIHLVVESTDTIHVVKAKIEGMEGIPTGQQVLFLPHKRLQDSFTLADYYFQEGTTLYLAQISGDGC